MKKFLLVCLLFLVYISCTQQVKPKKNTKKVNNPPLTQPPPTQLSQRISTPTGYEERGHALDTINKYRRAAGVPQYDLITVDTINHITCFYYTSYRNGVAIEECEIRY